MRSEIQWPSNATNQQVFKGVIIIGKTYINGSMDPETKI
jgi:hypothetical protein